MKSIFASLNEITSEIESGLEAGVDVEHLARKMGTSVQTFERVFSAIIGMSLAEYIRKRRLSAAAAELLEGENVLDVAVKYHYGSSSSFARAFRKFHGVSPNEIKGQKDKTLCVFPRVIFSEPSVPRAIEYAIVDVPAMKLIGQKVTVNNQTIAHKAPKLFSEVETKFPELGHVDYGMITYDKPCHSHCQEYFVLFRADRQKTWPKDFVSIETPSFKALCLVTTSQDAADIQQTSNEFYDQFLPSSSFSTDLAFELEYYHDGITELLCPIC